MNEQPTPLDAAITNISDAIAQSGVPDLSLLLAAIDYQPQTPEEVLQRAIVIRQSHLGLQSGFSGDLSQVRVSENDLRWADEVIARFSDTP